LGSPSGGVVGWVKLLRNKLLTAVSRIYALPPRRVNAEGWCSAMDRVEKKAFSWNLLGPMLPSCAAGYSFGGLREFGPLYPEKSLSAVQQQ
jgi:hypothetical protein